MPQKRPAPVPVDDDSCFGQTSRPSKLTCRKPLEVQPVSYFSPEREPMGIPFLPNQQPAMMSQTQAPPPVVDDSYFRNKYSAGAAAVAAQVDDVEKEEEEDVDGLKRLARAMERFVSVGKKVPVAETCEGLGNDIPDGILTNHDDLYLSPEREPMGAQPAIMPQEQAPPPVVDDSSFRNKYSAGAAAAAAQVDDVEKEEEEDVDGLKRLARAMERFVSVGKKVPVAETCEGLGNDIPDGILTNHDDLYLSSEREPMGAQPAMMPQEQASPPVVDDSSFRNMYSAVAAAAAAEVDDVGKEEEEAVHGIKRLAEAMERFAEMYDRVQREAQKQKIELEKQRMLFEKDMEVQRMKFFMDAQVELEKIKRARRSGSNGSCS